MDSRSSSEAERASRVRARSVALGLAAAFCVALVAGCGGSPLMSAAGRGDATRVSALLAQGGDPNHRDSRGNTALYYAAKHGDLETVSLLLEHGADPNSDNDFGSTPVHVAARYGHGDVICLLARHDADLDRRNFGRQDLLQTSGVPNARAQGASSPLERAARAGQLGAVESLVECGAELPAPRAVSEAEKRGHTEIASYLTRATSQRGPSRRAAPSQSSAPTYSRRVAAVLGVSQYAERPPLEGAARDARRVAKALRAMGFDEVVELYDAKATRSEMLDVLGRRLPGKVGRDDLVFIFFAGHGTTETLPDGSRRGYILPFDADANSHASGISMETVRDLSNRIPARHVYYAIDACYSGIALEKSRGPGRFDPSRAVGLIAAGTEGQQAIEQGGQGLFTTYLVRALEGEADRNGDGVVTASEIGGFVGPQVSQASRGRQTPQFGSLDGAGEIAFSAGSGR